MENWRNSCKGAEAEENYTFSSIERAIGDIMKQRVRDHMAQTFYMSPPEDDHALFIFKNSYKTKKCHETNKSHETITLTKDSEIVKEVFRINDILSNQDESESQVGESLSRLESMSLSYEILKETKIGPNVKLLRKHKSKEIRSMARKLIRRWREVADEQMKKVDEITIAAPVQQVSHHKIEQPLKVDDSQYCKQETKNHIVFNHKGLRVVFNQNLHKNSNFNKPASLPLPSPHKSNSATLDEKSLKEKIEASKKRFQEGYQQIAKAKRQRSVQLISIQDLPKQHDQQRKKMKNF